MDIFEKEAIAIAVLILPPLFIGFAMACDFVSQWRFERACEARREAAYAARKARQNCPKCGQRAMSNPDCTLCDDDYWEKQAKDRDRI